MKGVTQLTAHQVKYDSFERRRYPLIYKWGKAGHMDKNYSIVRRLWRIIYPPVLFMLMQTVFILATIGVIVGLRIAREGAWSLYRIREAVVQETPKLLLHNPALMLLISNLFCMLIFLPMWVRANNRNEPTRIDNPVKVLLIVAGLFAAFNVVQSIIFTLIDVTRYFPSYEIVTQLLTSDELLVQILSVGVATPIVEELVFRGILMSRMSWMPQWVSILMQGILFGAFHMNPLQSLYAFVAGILLGVVYNKFRSIMTVIIGHSAFNLSGVLLSELASESTAGIIVVASIVVFPICAFMIAKTPKARILLTEYDLLPMPAIPPTETWD